MKSVQEMVEQKAWLLHVETATVGQAKILYKPNEFISSVNKKSVDAPVLMFESGDAFVVKDDKTFVPLSGAEEQVYVALSKMITSAMEIAGRGATTSMISVDIFGVLASSCAAGAGEGFGGGHQQAGGA